MQRPSTHSDWPKTAIRLDFRLDENTTSQISFCPCDLSILFRVDQPDLQGPAFQHPTPPIPGSCAIRKVWAAERMRRAGGGCFSYHLQFGQCICMVTFQRDTSVRYHAQTPDCYVYQHQDRHTHGEATRSRWADGKYAPSLSFNGHLLTIRQREGLGFAVLVQSSWVVI